VSQTQTTTALATAAKPSASKTLFPNGNLAVPFPIASSSTPSTLLGAPKTMEASATSSFLFPVVNSQSPYADGKPPAAKDNVQADTAKPGDFSLSGQQGSSSTVGGSRPAFKARSTKLTETKISNGSDSKLAAENPFANVNFAATVLTQPPSNNPFGSTSTSNPFSTSNATGTASSMSAAPLRNTFGSLSAQKDKDSTADRPNPFSFAATNNSLPDIPAQPTVSASKTENSSSLESPTSATTPTIGGSSTNYRERLIEFYKKYNKEKLDSVDTTLASYKGNEDKLFRKLEEKYVTGKDGILPTGGSGPTCFLEFSIGGVNKGRVVVKLFEDKVPLATENFRCLCTGEKGMGRSGKQLSYQSSKVHRVVPGFCVQLGDFTKANGTGGESIYPPNSEHGDMWGKFKDEAFMQHSKKGVVSMANNGANRNSSQFFFAIKALPNLDGKHVVFGEVIEGIDIVEQIGALTTNAKQFPHETVFVERCGEIKNGKDVTSESTSASTWATKSPFGFGQALNPFASTSSSTSRVTSSKPFGGTSLFGTPSSALSPGAPSTSGSLFGAAPTPSPFGMTSTKPFGSGFNSGVTTPAPGALSFGASPSPFSFSAKSKETTATATASEVPKNGKKAEAPGPLSNSVYPPMSTEASTSFGAAQSRSSSGAHPPMSIKAPTRFGTTNEPAKTTTVSAASSSYPPMSNKAPTPLGATNEPTKTAPLFSALSSSYPPISTKAPTPFGVAKEPQKTAPVLSASSSSYPLMSNKAPTPLGAANESTKTAPLFSASSSSYPLMSNKAPTPLGAANESTKTAPLFSASSSSYPPMSIKAPTPFGAAKEASKTAPVWYASSSSYPPMSSKAPTPFGAAKEASKTAPASYASSSSYPPMSNKTPTPFGAANEPSNMAPVLSASSSSYPPMSNEAPTPFGAANEPAKTAPVPPASGSSYLPMSSKAPNPFGAANEPSKTAPVSNASSSSYPPMSNKAPTPFGAASEPSKTAPVPSASSSSYPPMSNKAPTPFGTANEPSKTAPVSNASSSSYPPMSNKAPTPFGTANEPSKTAPVSNASSSFYPPMSNKAPTPFGTANEPSKTAPVPSASSSSYPPMSNKAPTPFGTANEPSKTAPVPSASSSSYPPMSSKGPTPFGAASEPSKTAPVPSASSSSYPPMSNKAPTPFGTANEPSKTAPVPPASSSSYPPMSSKAPNPFGTANEPSKTAPVSNASSSFYPPMSNKAPTPFGTANEPSKTAPVPPASSSSYPPMSNKAPTPFGAASEPSKTAPVPSASSSSYPPTSSKAPTPLGAAREPANTPVASSASTPKSGGVFSFGSPSNSGTGFGSWAPAALTVPISIPDSVGTSSVMSPRSEPSELAASVFDRFDESKIGSLPVDKFEDMTDDLGEGFHGAEYDRQFALVDPSCSGIMRRQIFIDWYIGLVKGERGESDTTFDTEERDERVEEELKARKMFAELAAADATIGVDDFPKLIESLGTVYCEDEHRRTLEELKTAGDRIHRKDFVAWYIDWLFLGEDESDGEELTLSSSYGSPRSEGWANLFHVDKDIWKCEVCSVRNVGETKICPACETRKPGCEEDVEKSEAALNSAPGVIESGGGESNTEKAPAAGDTAFSPDPSTVKWAASKPLFGAGNGNVAPSFKTGQTAPSFAGLPSSKPVFGADSFTSSFGTASAPLFGAAALAKREFGAFGSAMPSFGATSPLVFGANLSTPSFATGSTTPSFGTASSKPIFGAGSTFGTGSTAPSFETASSKPVFVADSTFGTGSTAPSFGTASSKPVFGAGSTFSTGSTAPSFGTASSKPVFGAGSTAPSFDVAPPPSKRMFVAGSSGFKTSDTSSSNPFGGILSRTANLLPVSGGNLESPRKEP
jgi:cyclophilin family peptidyl-prolyl cis-trans isomerase